jgi:hypothetical protein
MKIGDKVKALVQIGLMKEPKWLRGTLVEENTVEMIHGSRLVLEYGKIKLWKPLPHDETGCPKVKEFAQTQWEELKQTVTEAAKHFLPNEEVKFDEEEKTVEIAGVTLHPDLTEIETIAEFKEIPCWVASYWVTTYSHSEPPDADEVICGHAGSPDNAARLLIDSVLKNRADDYWQGVADTRYAQCLED